MCPTFFMIECSNYSWEKKLLYFAGLSIRASGWQNLLPIFHCYFSLEITPVYMQYSCAVTEGKNQNLMMYVFCSNTLIFAPECWKCILRDPDFKIFPETCTFGARKSCLCCEFFPSPPAPKLLPPI